MPETPARFVWYELMTSDVAAGTKFYEEVIGWEAKAAAPPNDHYTMFWMGADGIGGVMGLPEGGSGGPAWLAHIGVDDVDAYAQRVLDAGGHIHRAPADIPEVGRFAVAADPHGAVFFLFESNRPMPNGSPDMVAGPGHVGWHELQAGDLDQAWAFYSGLFGWTKTDAMDMGPVGVYQMFATGGSMVGGMMRKMPEAPAPFWLYYFQVESIAKAMKRATAAGAKLLMGPQEVPGGSFVAQYFDPQGALFAMVGPKE